MAITQRRKKENSHLAHIYLYISAVSCPLESLQRNASEKIDYIFSVFL